MNGRPPLWGIVRDLNEQAHFVTEFHDELRSQLVVAAENFLQDISCHPISPSDWLSKENICNVFEKMKPRFLVYAPFVLMCKNVDTMIQLMKCDPNVLEDVEIFEKEMMDQMNATNNRKLPTTFNNLLALPFQHVLRYPEIFLFICIFDTICLYVCIKLSFVLDIS